MSMENDQYHIVSYKLGGAGRKTHTHTHTMKVQYPVFWNVIVKVLFPCRVLAGLAR